MYKKRILSLLLTAVLLFCFAPVSALAQDRVPEVTAANEAGPLYEGGGATAPTGTVPDETAEAELSEDTTVKTNTGSFPSPDADFTLTDKQRAAKASIRAAGTAEKIRSLTEGRDYTAGTLIFTCDTQDYAVKVAKIYGAELVSFRYGIAAIRISRGSVAEAVALASDTGNNYPPVEPEWIVPFIEETSAPVLKGSAGQAAKASSPDSWNTWVNGPDAVLENPDEYLMDPSAYQYQWQHDMIHSYEAWRVTTGDDSVLVAVIDSGVNTTHPDLHNVTALNIGLGTTPFGNHGTHVAGIIAATIDNGIGGAGVAPDVRILSIRAVNLSGFVSDLMLSYAVRAAIEKHADIINMSIGGVCYTTYLEEALNDAYDAGITLIASAGNNGDNSAVYPAAYSTVISVASVTRAGYRASTSSYGKWVDISAPGDSILSTGKTGYVYLSGTSMASPMVAGAAALYMSQMGHVPPDRMRAALLRSVSKCHSPEMGAGIIDVSKLLSGVKTEPVFLLDGKKTSGTVSAQTSSALTFTGDLRDCDVIYTLDGTEPTAAKGKVTNGILCKTGRIPVAELGAVGDTVTVKAAFVSKVGARSDVATLRVSVVAPQIIYALRIIAPEEMTAGGSVRLTVESEPQYSTAAIVWSITKRDGVPKAKINSEGVLSVSSDDCGTVTVRAASGSDPSVFDEAEILVKKLDRVISVSLPKSASLVFSADVRTREQLTVKYKTRSGEIKYQACADHPDGVETSWSSSNDKVVSVDDLGRITAVGPGTAKVTCRALDGSGKYKSCKVTVKRGADAIRVSGNTAVTAGSSASYKAEITPSAAGKKVIWSLEDAPEGVRINSKGKVTVPDGTSEAVFSVCAAAADGTGTVGKLSVSIVPSVDALALKLPPEDHVVSYTTYHGRLKSLTLFTVARANTDRTENFVDLDYVCSGPERSLYWTSSNAAVASVDQEGVVTAHKKGTATITLQANDGSRRKASVTVNVKVPASSLMIVPSHAVIESDCFIGVGCSVRNKAVAGTGFGKPSSGKVTWSIEKITAGNGDVTESWKEKKWATISSLGVLKIDKKAAAAVRESDVVLLRIKACREEERLSAEYTFIVVPKATFLSADVRTVELESQKGDARRIEKKVPIKTDSNYGCLSVSSSRPEIAGATLETDTVSGERCVVIYPNRKTGTATITIHANDGSGKTFRIKVNVTD